MDNNNEVPFIVRLSFADSKIPEFKEVRNKDWILYGEDNLYPEYLLGLYNKSSKHGAIINAKSKYIFGNGLKSKSQPELLSPVVNRKGETLDDVVKKSEKDVEIYGGFRWEIIWAADQKQFEIFHVEFHQIRTGKEAGEFYFKRDWSDNKEEAELIPEFNLNNRVGKQIFSYNEYRPGCKKYPLPEYLPCNNYIETDIEISKYNLSAIKNGMMPSKLIEFFTGEPPEDKKKEIEHRFKKKFTGSENGGNIILVFNTSKDKSINIQDLSATDIDKLFDQLNKTCQQEIITGHQIVSPMLFGIKTEGQLGGTTELAAAYEIFTNVYAKPKQKDVEQIVNYFAKLKGLPEDFEHKQLDAIGVQIDVHDVINALPKQFVFEYFNIPKELWDSPNIGSDNRPTPTNPVNVPDGGVIPQAQSEVNSIMTSLSGRQHQQVMRILRQFDNGKLSPERARTLLKAGYGLTEAHIDELLGVDNSQQFAAVLSEDEIIQLFADYGDPKEDFEVIKSKRVHFTADEIEQDELIWKQSFKVADITRTEADILDLIKKDKRITPEVIAKILGKSKAWVENKIETLTQNGLIESETVLVGSDEQIERTITKPMKDIITVAGEPSTTEITIKYSYEGPYDSRNRPFCRKLLDLGRMYSRYEIEQLTLRLGYSVFDRRGGFWTHKDGKVTPYCRHHWKSNIIVKKGVTK